MLSNPVTYPTANELRDLRRYLTPRERDEMDRLLERSTTEPFADLTFAEFCERYLRIQNKQGEVVPLMLNRAQRSLIDNLTGRDIVLKARHLGMSTAIQALHFYEHMQGNARTSTLCHEDELTSTLRRMVDLFYNELPDVVRPERKYANAKLTTYEALNSDGSIATVGGRAGSKKGRGGSMTRIHGSEVAFWPDARAVMAGAMQAGNPAIILESTPNGMMGWFYEECMAALRGDSVWTLHFFPWWWDDQYRVPLEPEEQLAYSEDEQELIDEHDLDAEQIKWRRMKQAELKADFIQEYPEDPVTCFLASGNSYFGEIEHVFCVPPGATYNPEHEYVGGLDFGQVEDFTALVILDKTTQEQVDLLHVNKLPWQEMRRRISEKANYWHAHVWGEGNSMGTTNTELLQSGELLGDGTKIAPVQLSVFFTTPASKPPLIQGLRHALHDGGLTCLNHPILRHEARAYISRRLPAGGWAYEGGQGAHDDTVIALALAWHGAQGSRLRIL